jgi:hypothetical protein
MFANQFLGFSSEAVTQFVMNVLAVLGGFIAGYVLAMILGAIFDKAIIKRQSPEVFHKTARIFLGLIVAILVALLVFGGGRGTGGGGNTGNGPGDTASTNPGNNTVPVTTPTSKVTPPVTIPETASTTQLIHVKVLGGEEVKDEKFYQFESDSNASSFDGVKSKILEAKKAAKVTPGLEIRLSTKFPLPREHGAIRQLENWAQNEAGLSVTFPRAGP